MSKTLFIGGKKTNQGHRDSTCEKEISGKGARELDLKYADTDSEPKIYEGNAEE